MPIRAAMIIEYRGERFRFYFDREVPELLHVTLRHGTRPDARRAFFDARTREWNEAHERFERSPSATAATGSDTPPTSP